MLRRVADADANVGDEEMIFLSFPLKDERGDGNDK
jgi:hypothetical protein